MVQYSTARYSTEQRITVQYSMIQYSKFIGGIYCRISSILFPKRSPNRRLFWGVDCLLSPGYHGCVGALVDLGDPQVHRGDLLGQGVGGVLAARRGLGGLPRHFGRQDLLHVQLGRVGEGS